MKPENRTVIFSWVPILVLGLCLTLSACCPSGIWLDNFGNQYRLLTLSAPSPDEPRDIEGTVDTLGFGCGIWTVRNLLPDEPYDPANRVAFVAENPSPSPYDNCCYAFRFDGNETGLGCVAISGQYQTVGGKCNQSGPVILEVFP